MTAGLPKRRYARAKESGAHGLRRGAWYLVVNESSKIVVLEVQKENVPVPHTMVELADRKPDAWSVVQWRADQLGARRVGEQHAGMTYGVCPNCSERQALLDRAPRMACEHCGQDFPIDWQHPC